MATSTQTEARIYSNYLDAGYPRQFRYDDLYWSIYYFNYQSVGLFGVCDQYFFSNYGDISRGGRYFGGFYVPSGTEKSRVVGRRNFYGKKYFQLFNRKNR